MSGERLSNNYEKQDWRVEREQDLARKKKIGKNVLGIVAATAVVAGALSHSAKTSEIMSDEERAKNVKKIEIGGIVFSDGVNVRQEPYVDDAEPNQIADIDGGGKTVVVDYEGDAYYYNNENDPNGAWYGFVASQLSDELSEEGYITQAEANDLKDDAKYGDGVVWCSEDYIDVVGVGETS